MIFSILGHLKNEKLPNSSKKCLVQIFAKYEINPQKLPYFFNFSQVAQFYKIWSHCLQDKNKGHIGKFHSTGQKRYEPLCNGVNAFQNLRKSMCGQILDIFQLRFLFVVCVRYCQALEECIEELRNASDSISSSRRHSITYD